MILLNCKVAILLIRFVRVLYLKFLSSSVSLIVLFAEIVPKEETLEIRVSLLLVRPTGFEPAAFRVGV